MQPNQPSRSSRTASPTFIGQRIANQSRPDDYVRQLVVVLKCISACPKQRWVAIFLYGVTIRLLAHGKTDQKVLLVQGVKPSFVQTLTGNQD